jgi:predicted NBD/HSP70 family sugar kinase
VPPLAEAKPCPRCGQPRCLEEIASGPALANAFGVKDFRALLKLAGSLDDVPSLEARKGLEAAARLIGTAIGPTLTLLNVEKVIVGGIGGQDGLPYLHESIEAGVAATTPERARADAEICAAELGDKAYAWGAALTALTGSGPDFILRKAVPHEQGRPKQPPSGAPDGDLMAG